MSIFTELSVSTSVVVGRCDSEFDIESIYQHLDLHLSDDIVSLKCNNKEKTKTKELECKTFYNQITISMNSSQNLKLFNNGKFQVSGVKSVDEAKTLVEYILQKIVSIKGKTIVSPKNFKGFYVYKNKILKKTSDGIVCSHLLKDNKVIINGRDIQEFEFVPGMYCDVKHHDKTRKLYNNNGDEIGIVRYNMIRKSKNLCIKNAVYVKVDDATATWDIKNKRGDKIGEMVVEAVPLEPLQVGETQEIVYEACSNKNARITEISMANSNMNFKYILQKNETLDREKITDYLEKHGERTYGVPITVVYDSTRYPGVKVLINKSKVTIFRTGSILISTKEDVSNVVMPILRSLFENNDFVSVVAEIQPVDGQLSIWDI